MMFSAYSAISALIVVSAVSAQPPLVATSTATFAAHRICRVGCGPDARLPELWGPPH